MSELSCKWASLQAARLQLARAFHAWARGGLEAARAGSAARRAAAGRRQLFLASLLAGWRRVAAEERWRCERLSTSRDVASFLEEGQSEMLEFARGSMVRLFLVRLLSAWLRACRDTSHAVRLGMRLAELQIHRVLNAVLAAWRRDFDALANLARLQAVLSARWQAAAALRTDSQACSLLAAFARRGLPRAGLLVLLENGHPQGYAALAAAPELAEALADSLEGFSLASVLASWRLAAASRGRLRGAQDVAIRSVTKASASCDLALLQKAWSSWLADASAQRCERGFERLRLSCRAGRGMALQVADLRSHLLERTVLTAWRVRRELDVRQRSLAEVGASRARRLCGYGRLQVALAAWLQHHLRRLAGRRLRAGALLRDAIALWRWIVALARCRAGGCSGGASGGECSESSEA